MLFADILLGCIGTAYFIYGKKQQHWIALFCGMGIIGAPFVVTIPWLLIAVSLALMALPFVWRA